MTYLQTSQGGNNKVLWNTGILL